MHAQRARPLRHHECPAGGIRDAAQHADNHFFGGVEPSQAVGQDVDASPRDPLAQYVVVGLPEQRGQDRLGLLRLVQPGQRFAKHDRRVDGVVEL